MLVKCNRPIIGIVFLLFIVFLLWNCGIEDYIYLEPIRSPGGVIHPTDATTSAQKADWQLKFWPADASNDGNIYYRGSEVLYRIYKSSTKCNSDYNSISSYNSNTTTQANIFTYLTNTMKFKRLCFIPTGATTVNNSPPLLDSDTNNLNRTISIRFVTYNDVSNATRGFYILDGASSVSIGDPVRNPEAVSTNSSARCFYEFIETPDTSASDTDTTAKTAADDPSDRWYVTAWAFAYGVDINYSPVYSIATYLGTIPLEEGDDNK